MLITVIDGQVITGDTFNELAANIAANREN